MVPLGIRRVWAGAIALSLFLNLCGTTPLARADAFTDQAYLERLADLVAVIDQKMRAGESVEQLRPEFAAFADLYRAPPRSAALQAEFPPPSPDTVTRARRDLHRELWIIYLSAMVAIFSAFDYAFLNNAFLGGDSERAFFVFSGLALGVVGALSASISIRQGRGPINKKTASVKTQRNPECRASS
jgi:hypothetical protein